MRYSQTIGWLRHKWHHFALQSTLNIVVNVAEVVCGLAIVWATKLCIDIATGTPTQVFAHAPFGVSQLVAAGTLLVLLMAIDIACMYASRWIKAVLGVRSKNAMQEQLYARLLHADWQALHRQHSGQLMNRLQDDSNAVSAFLSELFPGLIAAMLQFVAAFFFLYWMERPLALIVAVVSPILIFAARLYMHRMRGYRHDQRNQEAFVHAFMQESLQESLVLKTFQDESLATSKLNAAHTSLRNIIIRNTRYSANANLLVSIAFAGGYLLAFFWGVTRLQAGTITFGAMIAFIQLVGQIQGPIRRLTSYASVFVTVFTASDRLQEVENMPQAETPEKLGSLVPLDPPGNLGKPELLENDNSQSVDNHPIEVRLKDVTFAYDGADKPVLNHWSGTFPENTITAVVGHTGAGKTTLISILLGLLKPQEGEVHTHPSWFSYVPQGNTLFSGTIRSNLFWGNPKATDEEMLEALRMADAEFVLQSPAGLDMPCGERGSGLSEGQAQRVAIARALLHRAPILLLDEAFSALDSDTAARILKNITEQKPFRTIICITHRESLIPIADQVLRIK